jgi:hypothetical protein
LLLVNAKLQDINDANNVKAYAWRPGQAPIELNTVHDFNGWFQATLPAELTAEADHIIVEASADGSLIWRDILQAESVTLSGVGADALAKINDRIERKRSEYEQIVNNIDLVEDLNRYNEWITAKLMISELTDIAEIIEAVLEADERD